MTKNVIDVDRNFMKALSTAADGTEIVLSQYNTDIHSSVLDLVSINYFAKNVSDGKTAYTITPKGKEYFNRVLQYAIENLELPEFEKNLKL
jgi:hypothetical protein